MSAQLSLRDLETWLRYLRSISSDDVRESAEFAAEHARRFGAGDSVFRGRGAELAQLVASNILEALEVA